MASETIAKPSKLSEMQIAIVGLGLMGGSLALALRGKVKSILGIDPDALTLKIAAERQICDQLALAPTTEFQTCDLILLAMPVRTILQFLTELPAYHPGSPVVMDIGSTKTKITAVMQALPDRFDPIGGHPMCGKETSSIAAADGDLFHQHAFVFARLERTSERACEIARQLAAEVDAVPLWLEPQTHDQCVAATSHLPYLIACALAAATPVESAALAGTGYTSTTRISSSKPEMMLDILLTNQESVLSAMVRFQQQLDNLRTALEDENEPDLIVLLRQAAAHQESVLIARRQAGVA